MFEFMKPEKEVVDERSRNEFIEVVKMLAVGCLAISFALAYVGYLSAAFFFAILGAIYIGVLVFQKDKRITELENILIQQRKDREKAEADINQASVVKAKRTRRAVKN